MTRDEDRVIRLSLRDLLILLTAWGSLAAAWGVTAVGVRELSLQVAVIRAGVAANDRAITLHELQPWHSGYAATLPQAMKTLEDIQARLRSLEADNARSLRSR